MPNYPNFFIIGAQKAGTSSIHSVLRQHPEVFMSRVKELEFFNHTNRLDEQNFRENYLGHFQGVSGEKIIGEATASYIWTYSADSPWCKQSKIYNTNIPASVKQYLGEDIQFLVVLRDPVQRAVSAYMHHFCRGRIQGENISIQNMGKKFGIIDIGFYARHLREWFAHFPFDNFCIFVYEDLFQDFSNHIKKLCNFLNISYRNLDLRHRNVNSNVIRTEKGITLSEEKIHMLRDQMQYLDAPGLQKPLITWQEIQWLQELYKPDVLDLQAVLDQRIDSWSVC